MHKSLIFELLTNGEIAREIGSRFQSRRKSLGLSRKQLAEKSGTSTATLARFENHGVTTIEVLIKVARALDCLGELQTLLEQPTYASIDDYLNEKGR